MTLVDANLLLYAYDPRSAHHEPSRIWLEATLSGTEAVRFAWMTIWAFLRISTSSRVFETPFSIAEAQAIVNTWMAQPAVDVLEPAERHWDVLQQLLLDGQVKGPLVMDAVMAAIAIEHGATLCTTDRDFARFPGLKWRNPIAPG